MNAQVKLAALFLLLATGPLAEVLSQNVPLLTFLQPLPFLLVTVSYGVPVLLIRELVVARKLNTVVVALLGLAYGILNEGVLAKTLTQPAGAPLDRFASGRARWLLHLLAVVLAGLGSLYFLNPMRSDPGVFLLYVVTTLGLVAVALGFCKARETAPAPPPAKPSLKPALLGGCMIFFYVFQFGSPRHVPFALFFAATMGMVAIAAASMARARWRPLPDLLLFGIGDYLTFALFSALLHVASGREPLQAAVAGAIFAALFLYLVRAVRRQPSGRSVPPGRLPSGHA